uniref:Putative MAGE domain-containing protein MAGEA13P-like protein n=1 Tax=Castor fiber TaxID=10185 RepID=A0A0B5CU88_CASFI|nr:putative MAGE domain-containing protein MAGEA13P-like protein [Castor fiber]
MPHGQKSQQSKPVESTQTQRETPGLMGMQVSMAEEEGATATTSSSSTILIPFTPREVPGAGTLCSPQSLQGAPSLSNAIISTPLSQLNQGASSQVGQGLFSQHNLVGPATLLQDIVSLVSLLLMKYQKKELVTKAEMLSHVINHQDYFPTIFRRASERMQLVFGIDLKEVDPSNQSYVLVTSLGLTYDGLLSDVQGMPKTGLLIIVLGVIFMEGNHASEEVVWEMLSVMGVCAGRDHYIYGNPRRLVTEDFVQEQYLEYQQVPNSNPARYEFLWGPRAYAETSKMKVLEHWAKVSGGNPRSFPSLYEEALRDRKGAQE